MVAPYIGSGRLREGGFAATHKQDFNSHSSGTGFRHTADNIDMNPQLPAPFNSSTIQEVLQDISNHDYTADSILMNPQLSIHSAATVQDTLELMSTALGQGGFVTIGDGYDVGSSALDLADAFTWAFSQSRISGKGGVIVVKAGNYRLLSKVTVPTGFMVWGEPGGTIISKENIGDYAFEFTYTDNRVEMGDGSTYPEPMPKMSRMWNLTLMDNKDGSVASGGPTTGSDGMVKVSRGAQVLFENVTFIGRWTGSAVSNRAIYCSSAASEKSYVHLRDCFFDGVGTAFETLAAATGENSELRVENCRARTFSITADEYFIKGFANNTFISNNYHVGVTPTGYTHSSGFFSAQSGKSSVTGNITLIGNRGGLINVDNPSNVNEDARQRWLNINYSSYDYNISEIGNSWGSVTGNPWYVSIGDGTNSTGDITGPSALDIVNGFADPTGDKLSSRQSQVVVANPGEYSVTGELNIAKIIGNPVVNPNNSHGYEVIVNLDSDNQIQRQTGPSTWVDTGVYENYIGYARNIKFQAVSNPQRITAQVEEAQDYVHFKNVNFLNCAVQVLSDQSVCVENCIFHQDGSFSEDFMSLYISTTYDSIVRFCDFTGYGYGLRQKSSRTSYLHQCYFSHYRNTSGAGARIRGIEVLYGLANGYITCGQFSYQTYITDCILENDYPDEVIDITDPDIASYNYHIVTNTNESMVIRNCKLQGPDLVNGDDECIVTLNAEIEQNLLIEGNDIHGMVPVYIFDSTDESMPIFIGVRGNDLRHYQGTDGLGPVLAANLYEAYKTSALSCTGDAVAFTQATIDISNNNILGYLGDEPKILPDPDFTTLFNGILVDIVAPKWDVRFNNNHVTYLCADGVSIDASPSSHAAVSINTQESTGTETLSSIHFQNNSITHQQKGDAISDFLLVTAVKLTTGSVIFQGNSVKTFYCASTGIPSNRVSFITRIANGIGPTMETAPPGSSITNNTFYNQNPGKIIAGIYFPDSSSYDGVGIIIGNWIGVSSSGAMSNLSGTTYINGKWYWSTSNKNLSDLPF